MSLARRTLLVATGTLLVGCADPRITVPDEATPRTQPQEEPTQDPAQANAALAVAAVRISLDGAEPSKWRDAAIARCDGQLARFNSLNAFAQPDPIFTSKAQGQIDRLEAIAAAADTLMGCAAEAKDDARHLLFLSAAAATKALADEGSLPAQGGDPSPVDTLGDQRTPTIGHIWALIEGIQLGLGRIDDEDPLFDTLTTRLSQVKALREEIVGDEPAPSQPANFQLPTQMDTPETIRAGIAQLEVNVLEALVLLAAQSGKDQLWFSQLDATLAAGGQVPNWPGWN